MYIFSIILYSKAELGHFMKICMPKTIFWLLIDNVLNIWYYVISLNRSKIRNIPMNFIVLLIPSFENILQCALFLRDHRKTATTTTTTTKITSLVLVPRIAVVLCVAEVFSIVDTVNHSNLCYGCQKTGLDSWYNL